MAGLCASVSVCVLCACACEKARGGGGPAGRCTRCVCLSFSLSVFSVCPSPAPVPPPPGQEGRHKVPEQGPQGRGAAPAAAVGPIRGAAGGAAGAGAPGGVGRIGDGMQAEPACEPAPDPSQPRLWPQVVAVAVTFAEVWHGVAATLAELDVLAAFAEVASATPAPYVRPTMLPSDGAGLWAGQAERVHAAVQLVPGSCACHHGSGSPHCLRPQPLPAAGEIVLRGCRHPCLEVQEGVAFIPNDCVMQAVRGRLCVHPGCQRASSICAAAAAHAIRLSSRPPAVPHPVPSLPAAHAHACAAGQVLVPHHHRPQHGRQVDLHPAGRPGRPHGAGDRAAHAVLGAPGTAWSVQAPLPLLMHAAAASRAASRGRSVSLKAQCMAVAGGLLRARGRGAGERARRSVCARGCGRLPAAGPVHLHG